MATSEIIEYLGLERAVSKAETTNISEDQAMVIEELENIDIDKVYLCNDEERSYPALFIKEVKTFDLKTLREIAKIHNQAWNYKKVLFLYVYNDTEVRIYNCAEKPFAFGEGIDFESELNKLELERATLSDKAKLQKLKQIFSTVAVDSGIIWTIEEAHQYRKQINQKRKVDKYLVDSLTKLAHELHKKEGLNKNIIHKVILRSLFLLYLEDRGATDEKFYNEIKKGAKKYFDIIEDKNAAYNLYQVLQDRFNGNVFTIEPGERDFFNNTHLEKIRECLTFGYENSGQLNLFDDWRLFDFKIISVELLSEIYENFLADLDGNAKKDSGTFYTPASLVELILNEKLPIKKEHTNYNIKVLDPACGSGIFLVKSFKRIVKRYENKHKIKKLTDFNKLKKLLLNNIYGIEIDRLSLNVAAFSLYLALLDNLEPKTLWQNKRLPLLIQDPDDKSIKEQGQNLFKRDAIGDTKDIESIGFNLVVGNPPFGTKNLLFSIKQYCAKYNFAKESALPFLHKAIKFSQNGEVALIFNTKVLTNTKRTYQNFREWLFNKCYVEKVYNFSILRKAPKNFGGQLFSGATVPISIVMFQKDEPEDSADTIKYYAPKTFVKSNVLEGIVIDKSDVKYLPREECNKPDTKIWKIAMWGGQKDIHVMNKILEKSITWREYFSKNQNKWNTPRVGLNGDSENPDFVPDKIINPRLIQRFYTPESATYSNKKYYRSIDSAIFDPPFAILKKGQQQKRVTASYIDYKSYCTTACYVFNGKVSSKEMKALVSILNSRITTYLLFMVSSSWGIEREQVFKEEVLELPTVLDIMNADTLKRLESIFDNIIRIKSTDFEGYNNVELEQEIDNIIYETIALNPRDLITINDSLEYGLELFENKAKSKALLPIITNEDYAYLLTNDINDFLESQNLFANPTIFAPDRSSPLAMVKISFDNVKKGITQSEEHISKELKSIDKKLWKKETNIYFRKHLNYYDGDDIYIIRPNQRRFWTKTSAMEDASELILEILTEK